MAQLASELSPSANWTAAQTRAQFVAIARLRWHMLINGFRRKGGKGELVGRILIYPLLWVLAFGPSFAAGFGAFTFTYRGHLERIAWLLWGTFALCQLININLGQPGSTFDPGQLIRFPLRVRNYILIRLCFGLLTPANVIGSMMAYAIALGIMMAAPKLWVYAILALLLFSVANVLFWRMVFAWVDRWLSTRRAREIFTALTFAFFMGFQYVNATLNPAYHHGHTQDLSRRIAFLLGIYHRIHPLLAVLPPELTASSLVAANQTEHLHFLELSLAVALYAALFFVIFALRMRTEFHGELLSDPANTVAARRALKPSSATPAWSTASSTVAATPRRSLLSPIVSALVAKEFLYLRRNLGLFISLIMPVALVFFFAARLATRTGGGAWIFPAALAYSLMGVIPFSFNSFGLEGTGSQLYFFAPLRLRDVVFAKNLINVLLVAVEIVAVLVVISYIAAPPPLWVVAATLLWVAATLLVAMTFGNRRSLSAPKKVNLARSTRRQAGGLSSLIGVGIFMVSMTIAGLLTLGAFASHTLWVLVPIFAVLAAAAALLYWRGLRSIDRYALDHREELFAELCKAS
jgi:ABC-2 type transport system permease protein